MPPTQKRVVLMPKVRITGAQIKYMINFIYQNPDLIRKTSMTPYKKGLIEAKWYQLRVGLRKFGRDKEVEKWKNTWRDLVRSAKAEKLRCEQQDNNLSELSTQARSVLKVVSKAESPDNGGTEKKEDGSDFEGVIEALEDSADVDTYLTMQDDNMSRPIKQDPLFGENIEENGEHHAAETPFPEIIVGNPPPVPKKVYRHSNSTDSYTVENKTDNKYNSRSSNSDTVIETLNMFIQSENENERLTHEREMNRMQQNDKMMDLLGRMVNVIEDLAPSIKKYLNRDLSQY